MSGLKKDVPSDLHSTKELYHKQTDISINLKSVIIHNRDIFKFCPLRELMSLTQHFQKIKAYLNKIRNADFEILAETELLFQFKISNEFCSKYFTVHYRDDDTVKDSLQDERPNQHHYYLQFEQNNVPIKGDLGTVLEWKWYKSEDDLLCRVKALKSRYNY